MWKASSFTPSEVFDTRLSQLNLVQLLSVEVRVAGIDCSNVSGAPGHPWPACRRPRTDGGVVVTKAFYFKLTNIQNDNILFILILEKVTTPSGRSSLCCEAGGGGGEEAGRC